MNRLRSRFPVVFAVIVSVLITWLKPFPASGASLALTLVLQVFLPGYLLARALGLLRDQHPIMRFVWMLGCGLGLTIVLGGLLRYLNTPVPIYLLVLHGIMLVLALIKPAQPPSSTTPWKFERRNIPLYLLIACMCAIVFWVGVQASRYRIALVVPTVYAAEANWLANEADHFSTPDRWIGFTEAAQVASRTRLDGWTYTQAAWSWASGVPAPDLFWYDLMPLFLWMLPLITFATAYLLSRREDTAAWCVIGLTALTLFTLDANVYGGMGNSLFYGSQVIAFNTVRVASTILVVPLAIYALLSFLACPNRRGLIPILLLGHALAFMRVRQIFILEVVAWATLAFWWLAAPSRKRLVLALPLVLGLISFAILPFQYYIQPSLQGQVYLTGAFPTATTDPNSLISTAGSEPIHILEGIYFRVLHGVPLLGDTLIIDPATWFYSPLIGLAMGIGLIAGWRWRRSLALQYLFATTGAITLLVFVPGVTALYTRIFGAAASADLIGGLSFALPVPIALGFGAAWGLDRIGCSPRLHALVSIGAALFLLLLLFEPVSFLYDSPHDQIEAINTTYEMRQIRPFDQQMLADLPSVIDVKTTTRILTDESTGGYLVETFPNIFVPARESPPSIIQAKTRLLDDDVPFVDADDITYLRDYQFTDAIVQANAFAATTLLLQPERYELLKNSAGYLIFRLVDEPQVNAADRLFSQMNQVYATLDLPRWQGGQFFLPRSADPKPWEAIAAAWKEQPASDTSRFGLAMTYLLMGRDQDALPLWEGLYQARPEIPFLADALAYTWRQMGNGKRSVAPLLQNLEAGQAYIRVLAARTLLTDSFFYLIDSTQIDQIIRITQSDALAWDQLAEWNFPVDIRQRAALLMSAKRWDTAEAWMARIVPIEIKPSDLVTRAALRLMQGDVTGALALLQPATDADWLTMRRYQHPDRWTAADNMAAQLYDRLRSSQATQTDATSLMTLTQPGAGLVMQPSLKQVDHALTVTATFGSFVPAYVPTTWRALVVSPDASIQYGKVDVPAGTVADALMRAALTVDLPADLPPLIPARVIVQSLYSDALVYDSVSVNTVLNRPASAQMPSDAQPAEMHFGDHITLTGSRAAVKDGILTLALYWQTDAELPEDYQVFVHVIDANGDLAAQDDSAPVGGRYPTNTWLAKTLIEDRYRLTIPAKPGDYQVYVGLYRLADLTRLSIMPMGENVTDNQARLFQFTLPG